MQLVTIILTTLNSEQFVARSIKSCLNQTYANLELLIVDGGSTDRTLEIVANYDDPRIRVIHQHENSGKLPGALNLGMANAKGEFITWTQDDSWYELHAIKAMLTYLAAHAEVGLVYADYLFVDTTGKPFRYQQAGPPGQIAAGGDVIGQCFLFHRRVYETIGPQDERHFPVHEIPWRIRVAQSFKIHPFHQALMYYTLHPDSLTGKIGPWTLRYMVANALFQEQVWDMKQYRQHLAQIHIDHAYDQFVLQGRYLSFWKHVLCAIWLKPQELKNRGTWKLMIISLLPIRKSRRENMLKHWETTEDQQQRNLQGGAHA